jgi:epsilon-lactone hydrolase
MYAVAERAGVSSETVRIGSTTAHVATPSQLPSHLADKVLFEIHGGALIFLAGEGARRGSLREAERLSIKTVSVDYRVPPDHPYPAALDDCVEAFEHVAEACGPGNVIVCGNSAGGNLAAAMVLRLRDEGKPMPAALILYTPEVDLTESGDSFNTLAGLDPILPGSLAIENALYASGADLSHPYLSPLFGDFTKGFPPTFLQCGTRDLFLSNTVRMHRALRKAGVKAQLHVWEGMPHGGFQGAPEDDEVTAEVRQFIHGIWPVRPAPGD